MGNRSNINLVGNTTQGQNVGSGDGVYKGKSVGNILQFKKLSVTGTTMVITTDDNNIYFSANTGGGSITGAANGLSLTGGGTEIALGGTLTGNTCIGGDFDLCITGAGSRRFGSACSSCSAYITATSTGRAFTALVSTPSGLQQLHLDDIAGSNFTDTRFSRGLQYGGDYSGAGGTLPRWIPDAAWVTGQTGGGTTGTACMLAAYDAAGDLSEGVIITDLSTGAICNTTNSIWCISAKCGDSGSNAGKQLHVCAGNNYNSGTGSGGDLVLSAGDNTTGGAYGGGEVFLSPGIQASVGTVGTIFLGKSTYTGSYVALQACGSQTNVGIDIKSKGNGAMSFDAGASNINVTAGQMIWGNTVYISPSAARISFGNSVEACVCGAPGSSTTGHSLSIMGGAGGTTNFDGGTLILRGGTPNGTGDYGRVRLSNLPACVSETCTVFIDASGNLSTGVGSGGGSGTVTSVAAGDGLDFTTITTTGSVTMGTPSTITTGTTNLVTTTSHTHALTIATFTGSGAGLVPVSVGGTTNYLRADGSWAQPPGTGGGTLAGTTTGLATYIAVLGCDAQSSTACSSAVGYQALCFATGVGNTSIGYQSGLGITGGTNNIALGVRAISEGSGGNGVKNIAIGYEALCCGICSNGNIAIGEKSMAGANITTNIASCNIGIGKHSLHFMTSGSNNVAVGHFAGYCNTSGLNNVAIGTAALVNNTDGNRNIGIGSCALCTLTGVSGVYGHIAIGANAGLKLDCDAAFGNVIMGNFAGCGLTNASRNTFIGDAAGCSKTTGNDNIMIGYRTGNNMTTGALNVFIGCGVGFNVTGSSNLIIGYSPSTHLIRGCFSDNTICNGANNTAWNTSSDCRIKECVNTISAATTTLSQLNPVLFDYTTGYTEMREWDECRRINDYGFIAQEFETVFPQYVSCSEGYICSGTTVSDFRTMNAGHLIPVLVKAIQELEARVQALEV